MDEAAAILAVAIVNSSPVLQDQLKGQAQQGAQAGADFIVPYFVTALKTIHRMKQQNKI
jgi:hypothetical protein